MATEFNREDVTAQVTTRLQERFPDLSAAEIEKVVQEEVDSLADRPVHDYVAVLAERAAKKRLKRS